MPKLEITLKSGAQINVNVREFSHTPISLVWGNYEVQVKDVLVGVVFDEIAAIVQKGK